MATSLTLGSQTQASSIECDPTGKYIQAYGTQYDSSILSQIDENFYCENTDGTADGFFLPVKGCLVKKVKISIEKFAAEAGYVVTDLGEASGFDFEGSKVCLKAALGQDEISLFGGKNTMAVTVKSKTSEKKYRCQRSEGEG